MSSTQKTLDKYIYLFIYHFTNVHDCFFCALPWGKDAGRHCRGPCLGEVLFWLTKGRHPHALQKALSTDSRELSSSPNSAGNMLCGLVQLLLLSEPQGCPLGSEGGG